MSFASPELLLGLLAVPVTVWGYLLFQRRRKRRAANWSAPNLLPNMLPARPGRRRHIPAVLFLVALTLLLAGFARPEVTVNPVRNGATVVLAIDISGSMASKDLSPTRLAAASAAAAAFVHDLPASYRVGLVTFSERPTVRVPPTFDHAQVIAALPTKTELEGTAIGDAIALSVSVARKAVGSGKPRAAHPPAAVLLFSDGGNNTGSVEPDAAALQARRQEIPISTVSVGTLGGVVNQNIPLGSSRKTFPFVQQVPVDPAILRSISAESGGRFFYAPAGATKLKLVYRDLASRAVHQRTRREITDVTTGVALAFILAGFIATELWFRRPV